MYKLVAFDMDGTLLNSEKKISNKTVEAINKAIEAGKMVILNTGRCPAELKEYREVLPRLRYVNCVSGALVYDYEEERSIYESPLSEEEVKTLIQIGKETDEMVHLMGITSVVEKDKVLDKGKRFYLNDLDYVDLKPIENTNVTVKVSDIYLVMKENLTSSDLFKNTGGVHSVAIYDNQELITIKEDVARHNAMDKAIGDCVLNDINLKDKIIFVSGRISCEMILKAAKSGIPIVISKSAPTNLSVEIAKKLNITLAGFVRGERMNIYTNPQRIIFE